MGTAHRGRPQLPAHEAVTRSETTRLRIRVAWLLRINRLYSGERAWANATAFASAFAGGHHPLPVSQSKISRWETAAVNVPHSAVRRYEELLSLPTRSLSSTVDVLSRHMLSQSAQDSADKIRSTENERVTLPDLEVLLDQVTSSSTVTAADWDDLSTLIAATPGLRLRRREWDEISSRLLIETVSADGEAWKPRYEAFMRLLRHPGGQQAAIAACAAWARCRENHAALEAIGLLDMCRHPTASSEVLSQLNNPTKDESFAGALLACPRKVTEGHFSPEQLQSLAKLSMALLSDHADGETRAQAANVLRRLPPRIRSEVHQKLRLPASDPMRQQVFAVEPRQPRSHLSQLIAARGISLLPDGNSRFEDQLLPVLVDEMIFSPVSDDRLYAAFLIRSTPYRQPISDSLDWAIKQVRSTQDNDFLIRLISALRTVGTGRQRQLIELLTGPKNPPPVRDAAIRALGHMGGKSDADFWQRIFAQHPAQVSAADDAREKMLVHAAYSIGIKRGITELNRVADDEMLPATVRGSAKWWLDLPRHMLMSAEA